MPDPLPSKPRLDLLAQKYAEGAISAPEAAELLELIKTHPDSGHELLDQLWVHELLRETARAEQVVPVRAVSRPLRHRAAGWIAAAAVAIFAALVIHGEWGSDSDKSADSDRASASAPAAEVPSQEQRSTAVALLAATSGAVWDSEAPELSSPLQPRRLRLREGMARIDFFNGARVAISGPCDFEVLSMGRAFCHSGRLSAEVPPQARGFVIDTPSGAILDLGTSFGLLVGDEESDLHVFDGEVELEDSSERFLTGEGTRLIKGQSVGKFVASRVGFTLPSESHELWNQESGRRMQEWQAAGRTWNSDSDLLARFTFEEVGEPGFRLRNLAADERVADGTLVGCSMGSGRWPGKTALHFRNLSDRVRIDVPGELQSLTLTAWVEVHGLPNLYNSLLMADGFDMGSLHWQIVENGKLRLGTRHPDDYPANYDSPIMVTTESFGCWLHLASVVDHQAKQVRHYLNGNMVSEQDAPKLHPITIGKGCIGNWSDPIDNWPIRNFNGLMDEMTIHRRALKSEQIRELFEIGSPDRRPVSDL